MDNTDLILAFWFGENHQTTDPDYWKKRNSLWFGFDEETDREISKKFEPLLSELKIDKFNDISKSTRQNASKLNGSPLRTIAFQIMISAGPEGDFRVRRAEPFH